MTDHVLHIGDALDVLRLLDDESVDAVVTDPPYGIDFMGKTWDRFTSNQQYAKWVETWATECLRILKPGGYILAFGGTRTYHALAYGVEAAGFEIRDMIEWLYLNGFPKNIDVSRQFDKRAKVTRTEGERVWKGCDFREDTRAKRKHAPKQRVIYDQPITDLAKRWNGWGTALKPSHEPIVVARKPFKGTLCDQIEASGTGGIHIDACRVAISEEDRRRMDKGQSAVHPRSYSDGQDHVYGKFRSNFSYPAHEDGRFPANCVTLEPDQWYSRYFNITPQEISKKASKKDRNTDVKGHEIDVPLQKTAASRSAIHALNAGIEDYNVVGAVGFNRIVAKKNHHPTVKPLALMRWLVKLVTPPDGCVLDPFSGSGTTLMAAQMEGFRSIGIEREHDYANLICNRTRIPLENVYVHGATHPTIHQENA